MYKIEKKSFGFHITQSGTFSVEEVEQLSFDLVAALAQHSGQFSLIFDSRAMVPPIQDVLDVFNKLHQTVWQMSCERVVIVVESPVTRGIAERVCTNHEYSSNDRVIDARKVKDWQEVATAWATDGVEPPAMSPALDSNG